MCMNYYFQSIYITIIDIYREVGIFRKTLKTAVVKPLLKKGNLDPSILSNYRAISNVPFLGKQNIENLLKR